MKVYVIMNEFGEFSEGGSIPRWKKSGKAWKCKGAVTRHLSLASGGGHNKTPWLYDESTIVVEMDPFEGTVVHLPLYEFYENKKK